MLTRLFTEEDGATLVFTAICLLMFMAVATLAIDAGALWTVRRDVISGTDAAALAAASEMAKNCDPSSAVTEGNSYLVTNDVEGSTDGPLGDCELGRVTASGSREQDLFFAPIFGTNSSRPSSSSTAQWGPSQTATGLRPIALCDVDPHMAEWPNPDPALIGSDWDHPAYPNAGVVHRFANDKESVELCGGEENKWVWTCFDGNPCGDGNAIRPWLESGYPRAVDLGTEASGDEDCSEAGGYQDCEGKEGALGGSLSGALDGLICTASTEQCVEDGKAFSVLLYDTYDKHDGHHPTAFLGVILRGWKKATGNVCGVNEGDDVAASQVAEIQAAAAPNGNGNGGGDGNNGNGNDGDGNDGDGGNQPAAPDKCGYLDLEFVNLVTSGRIGPVNPSLPSITATSLCGADHDATAADGHRCLYTG